MRVSTLLAPLLPLVALVAPAFARSATGDRVLVVIDPKYDQADYSKFWKSLTDRGYQLTFKKPSDKDSRLEAFGTPLYDHLILFAPESNQFTSISPQSLLSAQSKYLNTLHILSPELSDLQRDTLREYDIEAAPKDYTLQDAFHHVAGSANSAVVLPPASFLLAPEPVIDRETRGQLGPVVYPDGSAFVTGENPFLLDIVRAPPTSYLGSSTGKPIEAKSGTPVPFAGERARLVSAMQNRDNVRVGFVASPQLLADKWWNTKLDNQATGNARVIEDVTKWLFQETGVVKVVSTYHHREGETAQLEQYRKDDNVTYEISLSTHATDANKNSVWKPFKRTDVQFEFTMLDPFIRTQIWPDDDVSTATEEKYITTFRAPDRHGVFKFVVSWFRPGYSYVYSEDKASVVPLRHDEHPRWIVGAYPFYAGCVSTAAAFLVFVALWINLAESDKGKKKAE